MTQDWYLRGWITRLNRRPIRIHKVDCAGHGYRGDHRAWASRRPKTGGRT